METYTLFSKRQKKKKMAELLLQQCYKTIILIDLQTFNWYSHLSSIGPLNKCQYQATFLHITGMTIPASKWRGVHFHYGQLQKAHSHLLGVDVLCCLGNSFYRNRNVCHNACMQFLMPMKLSFVWERKATKIFNEFYGRFLVKLASDIPDFYGIKLNYCIRRTASCMVSQLNPLHALPAYFMVHSKTDLSSRPRFS